MAFSKLTGYPMDCSYREGGDYYDFLIDGIKIDVKTTTSLKSCWRILAVKENGVCVPLKSDKYVFAYVQSDNRKTKEAEIVIVGEKSADSIKKLDKVFSPVRNCLHKNFEITLEFINGKS